MSMHSKLSDIASAALLAMLLTCGAAYSESIPLLHEHGTLQVPVIINGKISLNFTIDSGATDVSIPANVFFSLTRAGTVDQWEFECGGERAKLHARTDTYEDGTLWVADSKLLSSAAWHRVQGDTWKEGEMRLLCEWQPQDVTQAKTPH